MKKMLSLLMALLMLAMPTLSLADSDEMVMAAVEAGRRAETTMTLSLGDLPLDESVKTIVDDVLDALELVVFTQQGANAEGGFALNMSGHSILSGAGTVRDDMLYLGSNLLGEQAIAVAAEDIVPLTGRVIDLLALLEVISESDAAMYKSMVEEAIAMVAMAMAEVSAVDIAIDWSETDISGFLTVLDDVLNSMEIVPVTMQPRNCDPATEKGTLTVTGDHLIALWESVCTVLETTPDLTQMMDAALASGGITATTAEMVDLVAMMMEEMVTYLPDGVVIELFVNEDGELVQLTVLAEVKEPAAASATGANSNVVFGTIGEAASLQQNAAPAAPAATASTGEVLAALGAQYSRLTLEDSVAHTMIVEMEVDGEVLDLTIDVLAKTNGAICNIGMALDGQTFASLALSVDYEETETTAQEAISYQVEVDAGYETISFGIVYDAKSEKTGADVQQNKTVSLLYNGMTLLTVHGDTRTMDPVVTVDADTALRLATISDEEFVTWFVNVVNGLQFRLVEVLQALPASVLQLVLGT